MDIGETIFPPVLICCAHCCYLYACFCQKWSEAIPLTCNPSRSCESRSAAPVFWLMHVSMEFISLPHSSSLYFVQVAYKPASLIEQYHLRAVRIPCGRSLAGGSFRRRILEKVVNHELVLGLDRGWRIYVPSPTHLNETYTALHMRTNTPPSGSSKSTCSGL